jgi:hypothetical protein
MKNNITKYSDIPNNVPAYNVLPLSAKGYVDLPFFSNWIIGFTISEGSFYQKANMDSFFSLRQRSHPLFFTAFKLIFNTKVKIEDDGVYSKFAVSSKKDIQSVINFFSFSN